MTAISFRTDRVTNSKILKYCTFPGKEILFCFFIKLTQNLSQGVGEAMPAKSSHLFPPRQSRWPSNGKGIPRGDVYFASLEFSFYPLSLLSNFILKIILTLGIHREWILMSSVLHICIFFLQ